MLFRWFALHEKTDDNFKKTCIPSLQINLNAVMKLIGCESSIVLLFSKILVGCRLSFFADLKSANL